MKSRRHPSKRLAKKPRTPNKVSQNGQTQKLGSHTTWSVDAAKSRKTLPSSSCESRGLRDTLPTTRRKPLVEVW
ncbi:MAG: hypothetical protein A3K19_18860 [Lentisphaerae bacterium RIFOXYB12_FULL_65_16]|nr:MAG: hypothetical protein A3K18_12945 [Lentisphaerae bacterium RIFOXYA12_64_32]OGV86827.1 MAG: hypothetical protein A3K19_18860 [Lentisphaerae bacterium RIFOXYB12_FULL_65_16]